jgi:hypothetical protein
LLDSTFSDRELAAEAYNHVLQKFRAPLEQTISQIDRLIATTIQQLMDVASSIINGSAKTMEQDEIDILIG